ncbi:MAG: bifunctional 4-hydroxy-2-oxoglutarate aldolase/2-dehydro-3-deoxy-phosphogluconate aldolase [Actinomycetota bacterium]
MNDTERLLDAGLVPILRLQNPEVALAAGQAMAEAGLRAVEVTAGVPEAADVIAKLAASLDGSRVLLGAGTVLSPGQAEEFVQAGARFLVSPVLDKSVMDSAVRLGVPHVPAGFTPTEVYTAHRAGAPLVKLFPSAQVGPAYLSSLLAPLPELKIMPTGGLDAESAIGFIRAGAAAVGVGGKLCPHRMEDVEEAAAAAADLLRRVDDERGR